MLVCARCLHPIVFGDDGWRHRDNSADCEGILVAWPPPDEAGDAGDGEPDAA